MFYTLSAVSMIATRLRSKAFMEDYLPINSYAIAAIAGLACSVSLFLAPLCSPLYYLAGICHGLSAGVSIPLDQSIALKNTPLERWGAANALYLLSGDAGFGIACILWGSINDTLGYATTIMCTMVCVALSYAFAWKVYPKDAKARKRSLP